MKPPLADPVRRLALRKDVENDGLGKNRSPRGKTIGWIAQDQSKHPAVDAMLDFAVEEDLNAKFAT